MHIFYDPSITPTTGSCVLSEEESKHACRVLRLREGDHLVLLNGKGDSMKAVITDANPKRCSLEIVESHSEPLPSHSVHIAIAPTKNVDRIEWFLEKATEIGITDITFLLCKNNERKVIKEDRLEKILVAAMKQSKRLFLPQFHGMISFGEFLKTHPKGLIAHCVEENKTTITTNWNAEECPILIGPEGDFTLEEIQSALKSGYKPISLGKNRLRTETAGLYATMQAVLRIDHTEN